MYLCNYEIKIYANVPILNKKRGKEKEKVCRSNGCVAEIVFDEAIVRFRGTECCANTQNNVALEIKEKLNLSAHFHQRKTLVSVSVRQLGDKSYP